MRRRTGILLSFVVRFIFVFILLFGSIGFGTVYAEELFTETEQEQKTEKELPVDETGADNSFIWGKDAKRTDTGMYARTAGEEGGGMLRSAAGSTCTITPGKTHLYGSWGTPEFTVDTETGSYLGYCAQPDSPAPSGTYTVAVLEHDLMKTVLLCAPGGPLFEIHGNNIFYDTNVGGDGNVYANAHAVLGYIYEGSLYGLSESYAQGILRMTAQCQELLNQKDIGILPGFDDYTMYVAYNNNQDIVWLEKNEEGSLEIYKSSAEPALTDNNCGYSLEGAVYGIYTDGYGEPPVATITTDRNGYGKADHLPARDYWIQEITPPGGFARNEEWISVSVTSGQTAVLTTTDFCLAEPIEILAEKVSAEDSSVKLAGAEFTVKYYEGVYDTDPGTEGRQPLRTWIFRTDNKGQAKMDSVYKVSGDDFYYNAQGQIVLPIGTVTLQETKAPAGYLKNEKVIVLKTAAGENKENLYTYKAPTVSDTPQKIQIELRKLDDETNEGKAQKNAALKGAEYEVRNAADQVVDTLITDEKGMAVSKKLELGDYTVRETKASKGYLLDKNAYTINGGNVKDDTTKVFKYQVVSREKPQKIQIQLNKQDAETGKTKGQGAAQLQGAVYEVLDSSGKTVETLIINSKGEAATGLLPLDIYTVREKAAPKGYLLNKNSVTIDASVPKDIEKEVFQYSADMKEEVIRGNVEIIKLAENENKDKDTLQGLKGVEFTFTSKTTGKEVVKITTDKIGYATTASKDKPRGTLVFDTYVVTETKHPKGFKPVEPFEVSVSEEGVTLKGIYKEDKLIVSPVSVVKKDKDSGNVIPVKGTEFRILDADKNPVTMTTYYPKKEVHKTFKTDENGQFTMPDKLKAGTYYLEEIKAPSGYLKGEVLKFEITEGAAWENPLVIEYFDESVKGTISVQKTDAKDGKALAGAVFEILADEDIVAPDETIYMKKGEIVDIITTDEKGKALSKELPLGKYIVKEKQQPEGYVLTDKTWSAELVYKNQTTAVVTEQIKAENVPVELEVQKIDKETEKPMEGVQFRFWEKTEDTEKAEPVKKDMAEIMGNEESVQLSEKSTDGKTDKKQIFTTDKSGKIRFSYLVPGVYCLQEVKTLPGYAVDDTVCEITVDKDGKINGKSGEEIKVTNQHIKIIKTTAADKTTGTHEAEPGKECTIIDVIEYSGLQVGKEYLLEGKVMDKETGEPLEIEGEEVALKKTFIPEAADGTVEMEFVFDAEQLGGKSVVIFEKLFDEGIEAAVHEDIHDEGQTITFRKKEHGKLTENPPEREEEETGVQTGDEEQILKVFGILILALASGIIAAAAYAALRRQRKYQRIRKRSR